MNKEAESEKTVIKKLPRVMLAAASSNSGKTMITCALLDVLKKQGRDPVSFKCGPDYIDPMFHREVLGVEGRNLDSFFSPDGELRRLLAESTGGCAVLEGVMGIYDGADVRSHRGSSYEIAAITDTPVVLIVDASGVGRTVISLIKGILSDDGKRLIRGIILNRISPSFYESLKPVLEEELKRSGYAAKLLGFLPKISGVGFKSRHLGLLLPHEIGDLKEQIGKTGDVLREHVDPDRLREIMEGAPDLREPGPEVDRAHRTFGDREPVLAVARDPAFCFYYRENLEMFEKRGVKVVPFSPLKDEKLPERASGLLLGGGYPELFLKELSENTGMLESLREAVRGGIPSLAECGGFMYLHKAVTDEKGDRYETVGVVDGECFFTERPVRFGYMELASVCDEKDPYREFAGMRGHEFHYYDSTCNGDAFIARKPYRDLFRNCMVSEHNGLWGFPHFYYGSAPAAIDSFIEKMRQYSHA